ncbi:hypothetical protein, partial [uncultured Sphingorhabdus sp.]|uniref:hypothetical protein n=1 Tax=uncultured Sphingorhabdus sp. TaxID=1686106 RepID=UPI0026160FD9
MYSIDSSFYRLIGRPILVSALCGCFQPDNARFDSCLGGCLVQPRFALGLFPFLAAAQSKAG